MITDFSQSECTTKGHKWAGGKCYSFEETIYSTWFEARGSCQKHGGDLLVGENAAIHEAITKEIDCMQMTFWIAGSRNTWSWTTGEEHCMKPFPRNWPTVPGC